MQHGRVHYINTSTSTGPLTWRYAKIPGHWKEKLPPKSEVENSEHGLYKKGEFEELLPSPLACLFLV